jgi:folate-binding protein YgfZ
MTLESPLIEKHRAAGAELATYFGVALPAQFSDFAAEYRMARESVALVDTNFRAVFSLTVPDRVRYLNAVMTSKIRDLTPGQSTLGLLLNSQGHILAELETLELADNLLVLGHQMVGAKTGETLERFIIMDDAALADVTAQYGTLAVEGPAAADVLRELTGVDLLALPEHRHVEIAVNVGAGGAGSAIPCRLWRHSLYGFPGAEFLVRRESLGSLWEALATPVRAHGGGPVGYRAVNALRLEAGIPWFGVDFDERQIPHEAALEISHISYIKGCYTGQEIVERVRSRGHANRRLSGLRFAGAEAPQTGAALLAGGAEAGSVTSAAFSPQMGCAIGLGYVRREHNQIGSALQCATGSSVAEVEVIALPLRSAAAESSCQK